MRQEELNAMMRYPGERNPEKKSALPKCPKCGEPYCGDGVSLCTECATLQKIEAEKLSARNANYFVREQIEAARRQESA